MKPLNDTDIAWLKLFFLGPNDRPSIPTPVLKRLLRLELVEKDINNTLLTAKAKRLFGWSWSEKRRMWIKPKGWPKQLQS